ncbi:MAG: VOC family protein [Anaerolineae bacterium]|nr:VOC family protein [Anaerolineae bacterium]
MKLNHINLTVTDVPQTVKFLEKYFGLRSQGGDNKFAVLFDDDRLVLTLIKTGQAKYPSTFHIGFGQESEERVNEIHQRLRNDGFYVQAPGGFMVEVLA